MHSGDAHIVFSLAAVG